MFESMKNTFNKFYSSTAETQEALYTSLINVTYGVETTGQTIGSNCFDSTYKSVLSTQTPQTELNLKQGCSGGLFANENIFIDIDEESSFAPSAVTATSTTVSLITSKCACTNIFLSDMNITIMNKNNLFEAYSLKHGQNKT